MVLHWGSILRTRDIDVLYREGETDILELSHQFGMKSDAHKKYGVWLNAVLVPFPPMARGFEERSAPVDGPWNHIHVMKLDPHDLVISKLRRFSPGDRREIAELCDRSPAIIHAETLEQYVRSGVPFPAEGMQENLDRVLAYMDGQISSL